MTLSRTPRLLLILVAAALVSVLCMGSVTASAAPTASAARKTCTKAKAKMSKAKRYSRKSRSRLRCQGGGTGTGSGSTSGSGDTSGSGSTSGGGTTTTTTTPPPPPPPPPSDPPPASGCPLADSSFTVSMTLPSSCTINRTDTASDSDAHNLWGARYACADDSRVSNPQTGGDPNPTASGAPQGNTAYRKLTVYDGDNYSGERCELGYNEWDGGLATPTDQYGTFYNYFEGDRRTTYFSVRLPDNFPLNATTWQGVGQMKQAAPNDDPSLIPVLSFSAYNGVWSFWHTNNGANSDTELWRIPAQKNVWTRIRIDAYYSQDPNQGWIQYSVDANGDGDFADSGEVSPIFHTNTLHRNGTGASNSELPAGASIPSHLRLGLYHDPAIACPGGCSVDIDNVEVAKP